MQEQTIVKANKVPMETISASVSMGTKKANMVAVNPVKAWDIYGVWNWGCTFENIGHNKPSL